MAQPSRRERSIQIANRNRPPKGSGTAWWDQPINVSASEKRYLTPKSEANRSRKWYALAAEYVKRRTNLRAVAPVKPAT